LTRWPENGEQSESKMSSRYLKWTIGLWLLVMVMFTMSRIQQRTMMGSPVQERGADMVLTLPPGKIPSAAINSMVERWAQRDPQTARAWVEEFPEGTLRETARDNLEKLAPAQN
jgi:hypothetical protein